MTCVLIKRGNLDTHRTHTGRMPCRDESRDGVMHLQANDGQLLPKNHQNLEERHGTDTLRVLRMNHFC